MFLRNLGDEEEGGAQPEQPCEDYFETCCVLKTDEIIEPPPTPSKPHVQKADKCGVRNKNGAFFNVKERDNEAQFGERNHFDCFIQFNCIWN